MKPKAHWRGHKAEKERLDTKPVVVTSLFEEPQVAQARSFARTAARVA